MKNVLNDNLRLNSSQRRHSKSKNFKTQKAEEKFMTVKWEIQGLIRETQGKFNSGVTTISIVE